jgi:dTDP-4-dehydrorhamnose 3,5-epimerase
MIFTETKLKGAYIIKLDIHPDERGFFARSFCCREFADHNLAFCVLQCNVSYNKKAGTLRGMHYQVPPYEEIKLVRCTAGTVYDVIVDIRPDSRTYKQWLGVKLTARSRRMVYVPAGFAHGYLSLTDNAMVTYSVSEFYHPECQRSIRWDDPALRIDWSKIILGPYIISEKDKNANNIQ